MTCKLYGACAASLAVLALSLGADAARARSGASSHGAFATAHHGVAGSFRHFHRHNGVFTYWPGYDDFGNDGGYGPSSGEPLGTAAPPPSNDVHYTYTYDVPWDWAHRLPPMVSPSDHPYVPGCHDEPVTVPGRNGAERIINVTRCY